MTCGFVRRRSSCGGWYLRNLSFSNQRHSKSCHSEQARRTLSLGRGLRAPSKNPEGASFAMLCQGVFSDAVSSERWLTQLPNQGSGLSLRLKLFVSPRCHAVEKPKPTISLLAKIPNVKTKVIWQGGVALPVNWIPERVGCWIDPLKFDHEPLQLLKALELLFWPAS